MMHLPHRSFPPLLLVLLLSVLPLMGCGQEQKSQDSDPATAQTSLSPAETTTVDTTGGPDAPYVVTPKETVRGMLELADVSEDDVVYDLGSGDGRIPIAAAQQYGARGVGIELEPSRVERARKNAKHSGVQEQVSFHQQDFFNADFSDATVVTLYLFPGVNLLLRPMLFEQLDPGTRVVSHSFDMDGWEPDSTTTVNDDRVYLWTIPEEVPKHLQEK